MKFTRILPVLTLAAGVSLLALAAACGGDKKEEAATAAPSAAADTATPTATATATATSTPTPTPTPFSGRVGKLQIPSLKVDSPIEELGLTLVDEGGLTLRQLMRQAVLGKPLVLPNLPLHATHAHAKRPDVRATLGQHMNWNLLIRTEPEMIIKRRLRSAQVTRPRQCQFLCQRMSRGTRTPRIVPPGSGNRR